MIEEKLVTIQGSELIKKEPLLEKYWRIGRSIKMSDIAQFLRFCVVGSLNAVIDFAILNLLLWAFPSQDTWHVLAYNSLAVLLASVNSFFCNRYWTFQQSRAITFKEVYRFVVIAGATIVMNDLLMLLLAHLFPGIIRSGLIGANALKLAAIIGTMSISFFGMRLWVFLQHATGGNVDRSKKTHFMMDNNGDIPTSFYTIPDATPHKNIPACIKRS
jgi:putative flippase GtrA